MRKACTHEYHYSYRYFSEINDTPSQTQRLCTQGIIVCRELQTAPGFLLFILFLTQSIQFDSTIDSVQGSLFTKPEPLHHSPKTPFPSHFRHISVTNPPGVRYCCRRHLARPGKRGKARKGKCTLTIQDQGYHAYVSYSFPYSLFCRGTIIRAPRGPLPEPRNYRDSRLEIMLMVQTKDY